MVLSCDDILTCVSWCSPPPLRAAHVHEVLRWALAVMAVLLAVVEWPLWPWPRKQVELLHPHPLSPPPPPLSSPAPPAGCLVLPSFFVKLVKDIPRDFPGNPVVKDFAFQRRSTGSVSGWPAELPRAPWPKPQTWKRSNIVTSTIKDF